MNDNIKIMGINHITFAVSDLESAIEFYKILLEGKLVAKSQHLAYFDVNGLWFALNLETKLTSKERQRTYTHIAFSMSKTDQIMLMNKLDAHEISYDYGRPRNEREGSSLYVRDEDGHLIEFHSATMEDRLSYYLDERPDVEVF
jgi:metallothiol transferase